MPFDKTVGSLRLVIESNEGNFNGSNVVLTRIGMNSMMPYRMTRDELVDLQYLINRALEPSRG